MSQNDLVWISTKPTEAEESDRQKRILNDLLMRCRLVDTHYHVGPEILPRRYDLVGLVEAARPWSASVVMKNHTLCTTPLASLARQHFGVKFFGGVVLNQFVGGMNAQAVTGAISGNRANATSKYPDTEPIVVWMPTVHSVSHLETLGYAFDGRWSGGCCEERCREQGAPDVKNFGEKDEPVVAFDDGLRPTASLITVLKTVAKHGCVLATGHLRSDEIMELVPIALDLGVHRIIVTHPHYPAVDLDLSQMVALTGHPEVFLEHCFAIHTIEGVPLGRIAEAIRATGPEQVVLSSDFGQVCSDPFPVGTLRYAQALYDLLHDELSATELVRMFSDNGRRALGLSVAAAESGENGGRTTIMS